jgi:hypothetical protein
MAGISTQSQHLRMKASQYYNIMSTNRRRAQQEQNVSDGERLLDIVILNNMGHIHQELFNFNQVESSLLEMSTWLRTMDLTEIERNDCRGFLWNL